MSEAEPRDSNSSPEPSESPKAADGSGRVSSWISSVRAFTQRYRWVVFRFGLIALGLGIAVVLLWWYARNHKWLAHIREAVSTGLQILADPSNLPELLFGIGLVVVLTLWWLPKLQAGRSRGLSDENRFDRENEARKTLAQIIGGVFVLAGLYSSVRTFDLQRESGNLQREGQITDRFTKAIEQLGALEPGGGLDKAGRPKINLEVRLGGIYSLERISHDSPKDQWTIMEVLASYVREHAGQAQRRPPSVPREFASPPTYDLHPDPDIQAILTVIGRRDIRNDAVGVPASVAEGRRLDLHGAHLERAILVYAHLEGAILAGAHLEWAGLEGAYLEGAHLQLAYLEGAHLHGAHLEEAHLDGVDLRLALDLTQQQINSAYGDARTQVPAGLTRNPTWK